MANTLIFLIVGVVIALRVSLGSPRLWLVLLLLYLSLIIIRALSVWWLMPVLRRNGVGITKEKATVLVWGGLRGAVSLSLALSMAQKEIRGHIEKLQPDRETGRAVEAMIDYLFSLALRINPFAPKASPVLPPQP